MFDMFDSSHVFFSMAFSAEGLLKVLMTDGQFTSACSCLRHIVSPILIRMFNIYVPTL